jgi:hypothetical protein
MCSKYKNRLYIEILKRKKCGKVCQQFLKEGLHIILMYFGQIGLNEIYY